MASLIVGSIVSIFFAIQSGKRAQAEIAQRQRVDQLLLETRHNLIDAEVERAGLCSLLSSIAEPWLTRTDRNSVATSSPSLPSDAG